jgi:hypothetical protein
VKRHASGRKPASHSTTPEHLLSALFCGLRRLQTGRIANAELADIQLAAVDAVNAPDVPEAVILGSTHTLHSGDFHIL